MTRTSIERLDQSSDQLLVLRATPMLSRISSRATAERGDRFRKELKRITTIISSCYNRSEQHYVGWLRLTWSHRCPLFLCHALLICFSPFSRNHDSARGICLWRLVSRGAAMDASAIGQIRDSVVCWRQLHYWQQLPTPAAVVWVSRGNDSTNWVPQRSTTIASTPPMSATTLLLLLLLPIRCVAECERGNFSLRNNGRVRSNLNGTVDPVLGVGSI